MGATTEKKTKKEPNHCLLENSFRALPMQLKLLSVPADAKYAPVKSVQSGGIILVNNKKPEEEEELVERVAAGGPKTGDVKEGEVDENGEAEAPAAFKWDDAYDEDEKMEDEKKEETPETPKADEEKKE